MIQINLIPTEFIEKQKLKKQIKNIIKIVIVVILTSVFIGLWQNYRLLAVKNELEIINSKLQKLKTDLENIKIYESKKQIVEDRVNMLTSLIESGLLFPLVMENIFTVLPDGVRIRTMHLTPIKEKQQMQIKLDCIAPSNYEIATFISNIEASEIFQDPKLESALSDIIVRGKKSKSFSINFLYTKK